VENYETPVRSSVFGLRFKCGDPGHSRGADHCTATFSYLKDLFDGLYIDNLFSALMRVDLIATR
jgi:hypothetical protein